MLDLSHGQVRMLFTDREDKALQRCNLSARSMPGDGQEHVNDHVLLSSCPSLGFKAINLIVRDEVHYHAKTREIDLPVGHMSITSIRRVFKSQNDKSICLWKIMSYDFGKIWPKPEKGQNQG